MSEEKTITKNWDEIQHKIDFSYAVTSSLLTLSLAMVAGVGIMFLVTGIIDYAKGR